MKKIKLIEDGSTCFECKERMIGICKKWLIPVESEREACTKIKRIK